MTKTSEAAVTYVYVRDLKFKDFHDYKDCNHKDEEHLRNIVGVSKIQNPVGLTNDAVAF